MNTRIGPNPDPRRAAVNRAAGPGATIETLGARSQLLRCIHTFFSDRQVLGVTTPVLGIAGASDLHLSNVVASDQSRELYLQTSPEYFMKRLLAAGSGAIYQIGPAFRGGESGGRHNIEFTMLEWYRPGFDLAQLMREMNELVNTVFSQFALDEVTMPVLAYGDLFEDRYGINPHRATHQQLRDRVLAEFADMAAHLVDMGDDGTRNDYLDLLFAAGIERSLEAPTCVIDYPASQAALAKIGTVDGVRVAKRFELFWQGVELANGYDELGDSEELADRFRSNNVMRRARSLPEVAPDAKLLASIDDMPACCGVALGIDRLLMLLLGKKTIDEVIAFSSGRL